MTNCIVELSFVLFHLRLQLLYCLSFGVSCFLLVLAELCQFLYASLLPANCLLSVRVASLFCFQFTFQFTHLPNNRTLVCAV